jgi:hypothetical protein
VALLVIPATQEAEIRRMAVQSQPRQIVHKPLSRKYSSQKGLVEWLKLKALSSSPSTTKKKEREICSTLSWVAFPYKTLVGDLNKVCRLHK